MLKYKFKYECHHFNINLNCIANMMKLLEDFQFNSYWNSRLSNVNINSYIYQIT